MAIIRASSLVDKLSKSIMPSLTNFPHFIHTLYLFTASNLLTFALPTLLFAVFSSLSSVPLTTTSPLPIPHLLRRLPHILLYVTSHLLILDITGQRLPSSILEDRINKPYRPLPSGRVTEDQARRLLLFLLPTVLVISYILGPWQEALLTFVFTWMYNDLGGGNDEGWVLRNSLISIGYGLYSSAALRIACSSGVAGGEEVSLTPLGIVWLGMVTAMIFTTQNIAISRIGLGTRLVGGRRHRLSWAMSW
jgi:hypothetical protein